MIADDDAGYDSAGEEITMAPSQSLIITEATRSEDIQAKTVSIMCGYCTIKI